MSQNQDDSQYILAQLKNLLLPGEHSQEYIKCIFKKSFDINCKISSTPYLELKEPHLIGCTALHLAFIMNNIEGFKFFLDNGADYELPNRNGSTVIHSIVENFWENNDSMLRMQNPHANLILSAHVKSENSSNPCSKNKISHFHAACLSANAEAVKIFSKNGVFINQCTSKDSSCFPGYSPLHFAVRSYSFQAVQILVDNGADVNLKNAANVTPLIMLVEHKIKLLNSTQVDAMVQPPDSLINALEEHEKILQLLLQDRNVNLDDLSFLCVACTMKDSSVVEKILQEDEFNINQVVSKDFPLWQGCTALHFAAWCNVETMILLLSKGATIEAVNAEGMTPFVICLKKYQVTQIHSILSSVESWRDIVLSDNKTKLLDLVLAMQSSNHFNDFLKSSAFDRRAFVPKNSPLWPGFKILHLTIAISRSNLNIEVLKRCFLRSIAVAQDVHGRTALNLAYRQRSSSGFLARCLESNDIALNCMDDDNLSHLHIACAEGNVKFVGKLLQSNTGVSLAYSGRHLGSSMRAGFTPLHVAVATGNSRIVEMLMRKGADPHAADLDGLTPIHWILSTSDPRPFEDTVLSKCNPRISECLVNGLSYLHVASYVGDKSSVEKLLKDHPKSVDATIDHEADDDAESPAFLARYAGYTPLRLALLMNNTKVIFVLVKAGADIFAPRNPGVGDSTPFFDALDGHEYEDQLVHFSGVFQRNKRVVRLLEKTTGLTPLHVACRERNYPEVIERILATSTRGKVNARMHDDSPIWPGCTPLHVLLMKCDKPEWQNTTTVGQIVDLLLDCGLDVDVANSEGNTVVHLAHGALKSVLLSNTRNYEFNPVNCQGLSHFHVACWMNEGALMREFLHRGADVDRPVDCFSDGKPGYAPLHLVVSGERVERDVLDMLLERGAKVDAEDAAGRTVLHLAASFSRVDSNVIERIVKAGVDIHATDIYGKTALETLLSTRNFSVEKLKIFMNHGCSLNAFNAITENGYLPMILDSNNHGNLMVLMFEAVLNNLHNDDEIGRSVVHNIVSTSVSRLNSDEYAKLIKNLAKLAACSVDDQDNKGRTALHLAAKFANGEAVAALLKNGSDIDIKDSSGQSAFFYSLERFVQCSESSPDKQLYESVLKVFVDHARLLNLLNLYVSPSNQSCVDNYINLIHQDDLENEEICSRELQLAKTIEIGAGSWTVYDLLSEIGPVTAYPSTILSEQNAIDQFIVSCDYKLFPNLEGVIKLQYRKALKREELVESAIGPLIMLAGASFSRLCGENILRFLTNAELKNLITSVTVNVPQ